MICSRCGRINAPEEMRCSFCGAELRANSEVAELKSFTGNRLNINDKYFTNGMEFDRSRFERTPEPARHETAGYVQQDTVVYEQTKKYPVPDNRRVIENVSFENGFDMDDMTLLDYNKGNKEAVFSGSEKAAMRNTALLAVILAVLIDAVLIVCMLVYFKGFAERIVNVEQEASDKYADTSVDNTIKVNGKTVIL